MATPIVEKVRSIWNVVEVVVEESVVAAEGFSDLKTGDEKKAFVKSNALAFLKNLEAQKDFIPSFAESLTFKAVEFALDFIIDRVFAKLDKSGQVNVPKAA